MTDANGTPQIALIIPCFKVKRHILSVLDGIPDSITQIYLVDDSCPEGTASWVESRVRDGRIKILRHSTNQGVGGTMITGYKAALERGADILVKMDGDGQMDPQYLPALLSPLLLNKADYAKGNRFAQPTELLRHMPLERMIGNFLSSMASKITTGYWRVMDPNNGYTAIRADTLRKLPLEQLNRGFFFETHMLFELKIINARVLDIPIVPIYASESSNMEPWRDVPLFLCNHFRQLCSRVARFCPESYSSSEKTFPLKTP